MPRILESTRVFFQKNSIELIIVNLGNYVYA